MDEKEAYFSLCDVMIHARHDGESFGLAVAEMSVRNKPVMTFRPPKTSPAYLTHIRYLGEKGFYYTTGYELDALIDDFVVHGVEVRDYNAYRDVSPEKVMVQFENTFIKPCLSLSDKENSTSFRFSHTVRDFMFWMTSLSPGVLLFEFHHIEHEVGTGHARGEHGHTTLSCHVKYSSKLHCSRVAVLTVALLLLQVRPF
jgi:hypothetical protein